MTPVSRNLAANLAAKAFTGLLTLGLVPVYVKLIGVEAYGLVGLFATVQSVLLVLDLGLSTTLNRELARTGPSADARDLVRTLEVPYWALTAVMLLASWPAGMLIAGHWVRPAALTTETVRQSMVLMGLAVALQFPSALYSGGLLGLQRQVLMSSITVLTAVVRGIGAWLILLHVDPGIETFLKWQVAAGLFQTALTACALWKGLPGDGRPARFRMDLLAEKGRFAGGVVGVTVLAVLLTQADKVLLSRLLSLEQFGYYTVAAVAGGAFSVVVGPLFSAVFPRFSQLVAAGDAAGVARLYHRSSQTMAVLVLPAMAVVTLFPGDLMLLWTRNPETAARTSTVVALLAAGTAVNGLMNIPYAVQLAYGWTRLAIGVNLVSIFVVVPALWILTSRWGMAGAASVWLALNVGYALIAMPLMHRRLLKGELGRWYAADVGLPLAASFAAAGAVRWAPIPAATLWGKAAWVGLAGVAALGAAVLAAGEVRRALRGWRKG